MALYWPVAWSYWWNKPLAGGLEQRRQKVIGQIGKNIKIA
jgi:hypothetical protein